MNDERLVDALRELAEQDSAREAPAWVEARLVEALRRRRRQRAAWRAGVAAVVVIAAFLAVAGRRHPRPKVSPAQPGTAVAVRMPQPLAPVLPRRAVPAEVRAAPPEEVDTPFFPLLDAPPPFERGELVRVTLPASAMRVVGLPVREESLDDLVLADVLIGDEGMARAIRFVSFEP
jgi:hypothetical protein